MGYRTLTEGDLEVMNRPKGANRHFLNLLDMSKETGLDALCIVMAKYEVHKACIFVSRTLAQPADDS